ncbi:helix-turn-helix domain-containing protein [Flavobacterium ginsenosidimutans]|uniref:helix-turn-helix domain-containing protein n=1 Tax=Flavobacterium ginsenosidimutans TaxID=687844 RepID=UPI003D96D71A
MNNIITYSLDKHRNMFAYPEDLRDYFYAEVNDHPYVEEPYRAESYAVGYLKKGSIKMCSGLVEKVVHAPSLITIGPSAIRSFSEDSKEMQMDIIFFKSDFFLENQANVFFLIQFDFFENSDKHDFQLTAESEETFKQIFKLIRTVLNVSNKHERSILRSYLYILIYEIDAVKALITSDPAVNPLFEKFRNALMKHFLRQRSVGFYADQLNVSRKYLSEVIKKHSGRTAGEWIDEAVILEAKVLLKNKSLTINQISDMLNFSSQSVFGKFFKTCTGSSPLDYRKNN